MGISTEYDPLRPMAIQKNWHLTFQPKFMLFAQRSQYILTVYIRFFHHKVDSHTGQTNQFEVHKCPGLNQGITVGAKKSKFKHCCH